MMGLVQTAWRYSFSGAMFSISLSYKNWHFSRHNFTPVSGIQSHWNRTQRSFIQLPSNIIMPGRLPLTSLQEWCYCVWCWDEEWCWSNLIQLVMTIYACSSKNWRSSTHTADPGGGVWTRLILFQNGTWRMNSIMIGFWSNRIVDEKNFLSFVKEKGGKMIAEKVTCYKRAWKQYLSFRWLKYRDNQDLEGTVLLQRIRNCRCKTTKFEKFLVRTTSWANYHLKITKTSLETSKKQELWKLRF